MASPSQPKSLIFDLQVATGKADQPDRIFMVGVLRADTGEELGRKVDKDLPSILDALDMLGGGCELRAWPQVIGHDLPILKQHAPELALHQLPVIDTLRLSRLAFPRNSYHRLVRTEVCTSQTLRPINRYGRSHKPQ